MRQYARWSVASIMVLAMSLAAALPAAASRPLLRDDPRSAAVIEPADPVRRSQPSEAEALALVEETLAQFLKSVAARNMGPLRTDAAASVQRQLSVAEINDTFRPFFDLGLEPSYVEGLTPAITSMRMVGADGFVLEGHYNSDPQVLTFRVSYVREGFVWRWSFLHVALLPPDTRPGE